MTTATTTYNGWTNYETWNYALWLDNSQSTQAYWHEVAEEVASEFAPMSTSEKSDAIDEFARRLKEDCEENNPLADDASCWADLLGAAIDAIDWHEIASNLFEDV